jgi:hypothetical protein
MDYWIAEKLKSKLEACRSRRTLLRSQQVMDSKSSKGWRPNLSSVSAENEFGWHNRGKRLVEELNKDASVDTVMAQGVVMETAREATKIARHEPLAHIDV